MGLAILLLGLIPLAILPDYLGQSSQDDESDETSEPDTVDATTDLLEPDDTEMDVLRPIIDEVDLPGDGTPVSGEILSPVDADDVATNEPVTGDVLDPVDEIDSTQSVLELNYEEVTGTGHAEINNFDPATDILHITMARSSIEGTLDVDVGVDATGDNSEVFVEGRLVAVLVGVSGATDADVVVQIGNLS